MGVAALTVVIVPFARRGSAPLATRALNHRRRAADYSLRMNATLRLFGVLVAGAVALAVVQQLVRDRADAGALAAPNGDTAQITPAARAAGLRFAPEMAPADRQWILDAIARARPAAARLIAEVDGLVVIRAYSGDDALGLARGDVGGFSVEFNLPRLNGDRTGDRATAVLHELGHVIDFALVPESTNAILDAQIPPSGPCGPLIDCDSAEERFADTFAKWALKGAVSEVGAGYGIPLPRSLEDWGAPLSELAYSLGPA